MSDPRVKVEWELILLLIVGAAVACLAIYGALHRVTGGERLMDPQPRQIVRVLP